MRGEGDRLYVKEEALGVGVSFAVGIHRRGVLSLYKYTNFKISCRSSEMERQRQASTSGACDERDCGGHERRIDAWLTQVRREMELMNPSVAERSTKDDDGEVRRIYSQRHRNLMTAAGGHPQPEHYSNQDGEYPAVATGPDGWDVSEEPFLKCAIERTLEWMFFCRGRSNLERIPKILDDALPWVPSVVRQAAINAFRRFDERTARADVRVRGGMSYELYPDRSDD